MKKESFGGVYNKRTMDDYLKRKKIHAAVTRALENLNDREIQKKKLEQKLYDGPECHRWKKVFAWLPIKIHGERVWLKYVYKRVYWKVYHDGYIAEASEEYGTLFDVLADDQ